MEVGLSASHGYDWMRNLLHYENEIESIKMVKQERNIVETKSKFAYNVFILHYACGESGKYSVVIG